MNSIRTIFDRMKGFGDRIALHSKEGTESYTAFLNRIQRWENYLEQKGISVGSICAFTGDYTPDTCALMFALMKRCNILVPLTPAIRHEIPEFLKISCAEHLLDFTSGNDPIYQKLTAPEELNPLLEKFSSSGHPGLVVFSSGSTGKPKGILQDCENVMKKFITPREGHTTLLFLMMDHFGGFNTFLSCFAYGGAAVCPESRQPDIICRAIETSKADLLPVTPTFLNLLLASGCASLYNLESVRLITYGTEVMTEATLKSLRSAFPNAVLKQTYGLSELGVLRSRSETSDSVWVKIGGPGFEIKVVDGILWVRSEANMVGYLNAPNPIDEEGWMCTGDEVEVKGEYMRILGRKSDMINVGGQKVFPAEVESVLLEDPNVAEAAVFGKPHPVMGSVVHARITLKAEEDETSVTARLRKKCTEKLSRYKVPMKFTYTEDTESQHSARFKKIRKDEA